jgi:hypothetical protein
LLWTADGLDCGIESRLLTGLLALETFLRPAARSAAESGPFGPPSAALTGGLGHVLSSDDRLIITTMVLHCCIRSL